MLLTEYSKLHSEDRSQKSSKLNLSFKLVILMTSVLHVNPKIWVGEKIRGGVPLRAPVNLTNAFDRIFLAPFGRPLSEKYQIENRFKPILFFSGIHSRALKRVGRGCMSRRLAEFSRIQLSRRLYEVLLRGVRALCMELVILVAWVVSSRCEGLVVWSKDS